MNFLSDNGYEQYEISNFAKPGYECKHNLKYWTHKQYLSFGPSAASFFAHKRFVNVRNLEKYIKQINSGQFAYEMTEDIDEVTSRNEYIFLGLRSKGIDLNDFRENYKFDFIKKYQRNIGELIKNNYGYVENDVFKLTRSGYAVCDEISTGFIS